MFRLCLTLVLMATHVSVFADPLGNCEEAPEDARLELPEAMSQFAVLVCTPYGYIISNREGWIWTYPGSYAPLMIPSQMVRSNPREVGSASYFSSIEYVPVEGQEAKGALDALNEGFDALGSSPLVYRLRVTNQEGKSLRIYFSIDQELHSYWGIWCNTECDPRTRFMMLDMQNRPGDT